MKELQELFSEHNPESIPIQFFLKDNSDVWYLRGASTEMSEHSISIGFLKLSITLVFVLSEVKAFLRNQEKQ